MDKKGLFLLILIFFLGYLIVSCNNQNNSDNEELELIIKKYNNLIIEKRYDESYKLTTTLFKDSFDIDVLKDKTSYFSKILKITGKKYEDDVVNIVVDYPKNQYLFYLVKQRGSYKIDNFELLLPNQ